MSQVDTTVLVVGAGPAGMTAALLLTRLGVACRIVERRATPQTAPAAHVVNARTFEVLRAAGVDMERIADASQPPEDAGSVYWVTTLAGQTLGRLPFERQGEDLSAVTPTPLRNLSQHRLEPILADELRAAGVAVAYGHEWQSATQDADGVTSHVRDAATGAVAEVRSRWLLAADGAASPIRRMLGITPVGPDRLQSFVMIHLDADFRSIVGDRRGVLYWTTSPDAMGTFVAHDIDRTWVFMHPFDPDNETAADYDEARCTAIVRRALGSDTHPFTVRTIRTWTMTAQVAERYREGRVFLVGDAAHRFPPTGGLGLNTGVQDVQNLVWKIAAVEAGWAPAALLDTYERERRPVAQRNADVSLQNAMRLMEVYQALATVDPAARTAGTVPPSAELATAIANQAEHFDQLGLQLGFTYESGALVAGDGPADEPSSVREYRPSARPGARLPHAWVTRQGGRVSSLDLVAAEAFTLIVGRDGTRWIDAATAADSPPLRTVRIGHDVLDPDDTWTKLLALAPDGAILVRPDQHVAWRSATAVANPSAALAEAFATLLDRPALAPRAA